MIYPNTFEQKVGFDKIRQMVNEKCVTKLAKEKLAAWQQEEEPFLYNVNFPERLNAVADPFVFTKLGTRDYDNAFHRLVDEENHVAYQMAGEICDGENDEATDIFAVNQGYISVTPLQLDLTDYLAMENRLRTMR